MVILIHKEQSIKKITLVKRTAATQPPTKGTNPVTPYATPMQPVVPAHAMQPLSRLTQPDPMLVHSFVATVSDYVNAVGAFGIEDGALWFRGVSRTSHKLVPSLYRNSLGKQEEALRRTEEQLNRRFRDRSMPYSFQSRDESSDTSVLHSWWRLFTMQHYGTPTRLLDWSENAMTALCFAVFEAASAQPCTQDAVVWVLNPAKWNHTGNSNHNAALSVDDHGASPYAPLPSSHQHVPSNWPLAIFGMHNNPRIATQQGTFIVFAPGKAASMEELAIAAPSNGGGGTILKAIVIDKDSISAIAAALRKLGFAHSSLYPDLHGLSTDLKKDFGY